MRILHFFKTYYPDTMGGVEQTIHQLALATQAFGIKTDVLTLSPNVDIPTVDMNGYQVHRAKKTLEVASTGFSIDVFKQFYQLAKKADLIHYHFPWPFMDLVHFLVPVKKPTVVTYHSDIVKQKFLFNLYHPLCQRFLKSVNRIVATSPNYCKTSPILKQYQEKITVIPIGLDESTYPEPSEKLLAHWRQRFPKPFFLFVGILRYYKGLHILLHAIKNKPYPVVIVGEGPIKSSLKQLKKELNLDNLYFLGALPEIDKVALLKLAHAVVFPSHLRSEAFGISLLEGAMYGKPLISTEIGTGTSYININEETGFVVPPSDVESLSAAMEKLWANPAGAEQMGHRAQKRYRELFTAKTMGLNYLNVYNALLLKA